jgi:transposase
MHARNEAKRA